MSARLILITLLALGLNTVARAQSSLAEALQQTNASWMLGKWQAQSDDGSTIQLELSWDLSGKLGILHIKTPDNEAKGFTVLEPDSGEISYFGADSQGSVTRGTWSREDGEIVLRVTTQRTQREPWKMGVVFTGSATEGLRLRLHSLQSYGGLVYPANATLHFRKV
jgi:hypothetical protein